MLARFSTALAITLLWAAATSISAFVPRSMPLHRSAGVLSTDSTKAGVFTSMPVNPLRFKDTAKLWMSSRRPQNNQSTNRDFYKILGVARGADAAEIKKGYRTKAKLLHPDANPGQDTTEQFQEVNRAYEVLTDPDLKTKYDRATATLIVRATSTAWYWRRA
jgi:hypothetical protein